VCVCVHCENAYRIDGSKPVDIREILQSYINRHQTHVVYIIQGDPGVKVTTSGFNSKADWVKNVIYTWGPIRNGSGVMSF